MLIRSHADLITSSLLHIPDKCRGIDYALSSNDIPGVAHCLPPLIKQVNLLKVYFSPSEKISV